MLSRKHFFMLMMVGLVLSVFVTNVMGENLIKVGEDKGTVSYYDKNSVKRKSEIVKVWVQIGFNEKNEEWKSWVDLCVNNSKLNSNPNCNKLYVIKGLYEINCKEDTFRILSIVTYDEDGRSLPTSKYLSSMNHHIVPNSINDGLKNRVCE